MDDIGFWLKKFITFSLYPLPIVLVLLIGGFWTWSRGNTFRGKLLVLGAGIWLSIWTFPFVPNHLLAVLEENFQRLGNREQILQQYPGVDQSTPYIVVLGAGVMESIDPTVPELAKLPDAGIRRVLEAVRLHQYFPQTKIIMSGGDGEAPTMSRVAMVLGVEKEALLQENTSKDTEDQARLIKPLVQGQRFFLVTSNWHMLRSAGLFRKQGLRFIPAPTDFTRLKEDYHYQFNYTSLPNASYLNESEVLIKEYLGIAFATLKGVFSHAEPASL